MTIAIRGKFKRNNSGKTKNKSERIKVFGMCI